MLTRRQALFAPLPWMVGGATASATPERLATAWRADGVDRAGVLEVDWPAGRLRITHQLDLPSRAHGLLPLPDGGFLVVANRPGRWLLRVAADGAVRARWSVPDGDPTFNGHLVLAGDGAHVLSTETDPATGQGCLQVRRLDTLAPEAHWPSHGIDPHQLLKDGSGALWVANGGIVRDTAGRKIDGERMSPSLVKLDGGTGKLLGQWTLPDTHLSIRHLAFNEGGLLGLALQAEHDSPAERFAAPVLAVCDGRTLAVPTADAQAGGYAGDIAAAPGGGFVVSAQKQGTALWWHPAAPGRLTRVAQLTEPCGLLTAPDGAGTLLSAGRGLALWHAREAPRMLAWPAALAPDNHLVRLSTPRL